jgi:hypothetical protein
MAASGAPGSGTPRLKQSTPATTSRSCPVNHKVHGALGGMSLRSDDGVTNGEIVTFA